MNITRRTIFKQSVGIILASIFLLGCGLTDTVKNMFATPTPTPTLTPTFTPSPTSTSTPTTPPTPTFTPSPTPLPDLTGAVLTLADLPAGFVEMPPEELGFSPSSFSSQGMQFASSFGYANTADMEFLFGFNYLLLGSAGKVSFDVMINNPDLMTQSLTTGFTSQGGSVEGQETLTGLEEIGDIASGVGLVVNTGGIRMRMDVITFERGSTGSVLLVMYLDGATPPVSSASAAEKWDGKIEQALGNY